VSQTFLPYGRQCIEEDDIAAVVAVLRGDFLTTGPAVEFFEKALAERVEARFAVACSSGTTALHLAMAALEMGPEDKVAVPSMTFLATANAVQYVGAEVEFVDVDPRTGLASPATFEQVIGGASGNRLRSLVPVHLAGQCVDMPGLAATARRHNLRIVEDAAHALGTTYLDENGETVPVGACRHSDMTIFSFHPVKTVAMGEGGAVTTNDPELYESLLRLRSHGMTRNASEFNQIDMAVASDGSVNPWYYEMVEPGFNYRATDIHCALGKSQLGKLSRFKENRRKLVALYDRRIASLAPTVRPIQRVEGCDPGWHLYPVLINFDAIGQDRASLMLFLREQGIGSQVHYIPVHLQPYYQRRYGAMHLPGAETYYAQTLSLPLFVGMTDADVERVVTGLAEVTGNAL